ncbi:hypothetical protein AX15_005066 [Amanita polypyramis BW_CC]|nr:hypothetical protein AX15_005066 [Amanita polypyramis BW_CC]
MSSQSQSSTNADEQNVDNHYSTSSEKERVLWEAFREEHFEAVEQLPLAIHRQYSLVRELDERARYCVDQLQPLLRDYISGRLSHDTSVSNGVSERESHPLAFQSPEKNNRRLLTRIVRLSDDLVRASEENVNISLAVNNSVRSSGTNVFNVAE